MPTLDWIGKKAVVNHHRDVPYRLVCTVPDDRLAKLGVTFKQIPYQIEGI